jgi:hypothetical protein
MSTSIAGKEMLEITNKAVFRMLEDGDKGEGVLASFNSTMPGSTISLGI